MCVCVFVNMCFEWPVGMENGSIKIEYSKENPTNKRVERTDEQESELFASELKS